MSDILVHTSKSVYVGFSIFARTHAYDRASVGEKVFCWLTQFYSVTRLITTFLTILCLLLVRLVLLVSLKLPRNMVAGTLDLRKRVLGRPQTLPLLGFRRLRKSYLPISK